MAACLALPADASRWVQVTLPRWEAGPPTWQSPGTGLGILQPPLLDDHISEEAVMGDAARRLPHTLTWAASSPGGQPDRLGLPARRYS